ncbi:MAG: hypothetical protein R3B70_30950 [Polyangiaceae bacterium]
MAYPAKAWLAAFVFTQVFEIPVYVLALRHAVRTEHGEPPRTLSRQALAAFGASAITHPAVWYLIPLIPASFADPLDAWREYVVRAEVFAVVVEAVYFHWIGAFSLRRAFAWSLLANAVSAGLGQLSRAYLHFP